MGVHEPWYYMVFIVLWNSCMKAFRQSMSTFICECYKLLSPSLHSLEFQLISKNHLRNGELSAPSTAKNKASLTFGVPHLLLVLSLTPGAWRLREPSTCPSHRHHGHQRPCRLMAGEVYPRKCCSCVHRKNPPGTLGKFLGDVIVQLFVFLKWFNIFIVCFPPSF